MHLIYKVNINDIVSGILKALLYGNIVTLVYCTGTGTAFNGIVYALTKKCDLGSFFFGDRQGVVLVFQKNHTLCCDVLSCCFVFDFTIRNIRICCCCQCTCAAGKYHCKRHCDCHHAF